MKKHTLRPLVAALMLSPLAASLAHAAPAGRVLMVIGEAGAERAGQKIALKRGTLVEEGDKLITGPGASAQVMFTDQGLVALRENTVFKIDKFSFQKGADAANFKLEKGGVRTVTGQVGKANNKDYSLDAVVATIGIRGTNFELVLCEGQCAQGGETAKNGLYGVVRGASGGTSRITIRNDGGEKLLGKNDAFFVADKQSPAQQLVAPPSFVTARTESSKKSGDKSSEKSAEQTKEAEKKPEDKGGETKETKETKEAKDAKDTKDTQQAEKQPETKQAESKSTGNTDGAPPPPRVATTDGNSSSPPPSGATPPTPPQNSTSQIAAKTQATSTSTGITNIDAKATFGTISGATTTALVPPPTNQSLLTAPPVPISTSTVPVIEGGSAQSSPGGTTVTAATGGNSTTPPPPTTPPITNTTRSAVLSVVRGTTELSSSVHYGAGGPVTFLSDGLTPTVIDISHDSTSGSTTQTYLNKYTQGDVTSINIDGHTTANNLTEYVWGRWGGASVTETSGISGSSTSDSTLPTFATNLHFVSGPLLAQTPTSGFATYKLFGATLPTYNEIGLPTETGRVTRVNDTNSLLASLTSDPLLAKVVFNFGAGLDPYIVVEPFRAMKENQTEGIYFAGEGSRPGAFKGILLQGNKGEVDKGHFFGFFLNGMFVDERGIVSFQSGHSGSVAGQLMDTAAGGLGLSYRAQITGSNTRAPGVVNGALVFRKDPATVQALTYPSVTTGALSLASFITSDLETTPRVTTSTGGLHSLNIQSVNDNAGNALPTAFMANSSTLANYGVARAAPTPIVREDNNVLSGYTWGRWVTPLVYGGGQNNAFFTGGSVAHIRDNSGNALTNLHFVTGPELDQLPSSGFATYFLRGSTTATGAQSKNGTVSLANGSTAVGQLKADLGFSFATDGTIPGYLRIQSFKLTDTNNSAESIILAGRDSVLNEYRPIHLVSAGPQDPGVFEGGTNKIYKTTSQNPSPFRDTGASAFFSAQLMGSGATGLGVSYSINTQPGGDGEAIGSLVFTRDTSPLVTPNVTTGPGAAVASIVSFANAQPGNPPVVSNFSAELKANDNGSITLVDNQPKGIQFENSNGQVNTLANYSFSTATQNLPVVVDGSHVTPAGDTYYWGRWAGGSIVSSLGGAPRDENPIAQVQFVTGPAVSSLPTSGLAIYQIHVSNGTFAATPPISSDPVVRQFQQATASASPLPITATVSFSPTANTMTLSTFNLANDPGITSPNPANALVITGPGSIFSGPSLLSPQNINFSQAAGSTQQQGRFTSNNATVYDGNGTLKNGATANLTGQLMGTAGEGLGVAYGVTFPRPSTPGVQDTVTGAFLLKKQGTQ